MKIDAEMMLKLMEKQADAMLKTNDNIKLLAEQMKSLAELVVEFRNELQHNDERR